MLSFHKEDSWETRGWYKWESMVCSPSTANVGITPYARSLSGEEALPTGSVLRERRKKTAGAFCRSCSPVVRNSWATVDSREGSLGGNGVGRKGGGGGV